MDNQLPEIIEFTGTGITEGDFKVALNKLLLYLAEAIGTDGGNLFPKGFIGIWSGATNKIPAGWALCNGENGTPDLRDRFVVGAGGEYTVGAMGGNNSQTVTISGQAGETTLTIAQIPRHNHGVSGWVADAVGENIALTNQSGRYSGSTLYAGGSGSHSHSISGESTFTTLPPYYALAYIMKV